jgi:hypothetical protein
MSRARLAIAIGVLVVFAVIGGFIIRANQHQGGQSVTFNLTVTGAKTMSPSTISAHVNDTITINIASDTDGEVHLHVYDIKFDTKAGQTVSHTFKADKTCGCDIEWESTSTPLGSLTVSP